MGAPLLKTDDGGRGTGDRRRGRGTGDRRPATGKLVGRLNLRADRKVPDVEIMHPSGGT